MKLLSSAIFGDFSVILYISIFICQNSHQVFRGTLKFINSNYRHVITPFSHREWNSFHWHLWQQTWAPLKVNRDIFRARPIYTKILSHLTYLTEWLPRLSPEVERRINIHVQESIMNVLNHQLLKLPAGAVSALISQSLSQRYNCVCSFLSRGRSKNVAFTWPVLSSRITATQDAC